jgi:hypothetical protein
MFTYPVGGPFEKVAFPFSYETVEGLTVRAVAVGSSGLAEGATVTVYELEDAAAKCASPL